MEYSWSVNIYDYEGSLIDECVLAHLDNNIILKFKDPSDLEQFAKEILRSLPEIRSNYPNP